MGLKRTWIRPVDSRMDSLSKAYKQSDSLSQLLQKRMKQSPVVLFSKLSDSNHYLNWCLLPMT